jgi:hypothetical protein
MKISLPFQFNQCLTGKPLPSNRNFVVIYENNLLGDSNFITGYLNYAQRVVMSFEGNEPNASDDIIVTPLLNTYTNVLEFIFKKLIRFLGDHSKTCSDFSSMEDEIKSVLKTHDLKSQADIIEKMLLKSSNLHPLENFHLINNYVVELCDYGVFSHSTRYLAEKSNEKIFPLYTKQSWLYLRNMHDTIKKIVNDIECYMYSDDFVLCKGGYIKDKKIKELSFSCKSLEGNLDNIESKLRGPLLSNNSHNQLAAIVHALYHSNRGLSDVEPLQYFIEWSDEIIINKIIERSYHARKALMKMKENINYLKKLIKTKEKF